MQKLTLIMASDQVTSNDSHFHLARHLVEHGVRVLILDVANPRQKCFRYNAGFSQDNFSDFFKTAEAVDPDELKGGYYLPRLDPPILIYRAAIISCLMRPATGINRIEGVSLAQSKAILPMLFPDYGDYRIVSTLEEVDRALVEFPNLVLKPLTGFGGRGLLRLTRTASEGSLPSSVSFPALAMPFLQEIVNGERRTFVIDGKPVGALDKKPAPGGWLTNMSQGGTASYTRLDRTDYDLAADVAGRMAPFGIRFFAVDTVYASGTRKIIEINVSNPGGITLIDQHSNNAIAIALREALGAPGG